MASYLGGKGYMSHDMMEGQLLMLLLLLSLISSR